MNRNLNDEEKAKIEALYPDNDFSDDQKYFLYEMQNEHPDWDFSYDDDGTVKITKTNGSSFNVYENNDRSYDAQVSAMYESDNRNSAINVGDSFSELSNNETRKALVKIQEEHPDWEISIEGNPGARYVKIVRTDTLPEDSTIYFPDGYSYGETMAGIRKNSPEQKYKDESPTDLYRKYFYQNNQVNDQGETVDMVNNAFEVKIDDEGYAHLYSEGREVAVSNKKINNETDLIDAFSSFNSDAVKDTESHNDILFSKGNFNSSIKYTDSLGEHTVTLSKEEMEEYIKMSDDEKLKYLKNKSLSQYSIAGKNAEEFTSIVHYYDNNGARHEIFVNEDDYAEISRLRATSDYDSASKLLFEKYGVKVEPYAETFGMASYYKNTGVEVKYTDDKKNEKTIKLTDEEYYDYVSKNLDKDLAAKLLGDNSFKIDSWDSKFDANRREITITYKDAKGNTRTKKISLSDSNDEISKLIVQSKVNEANGSSGKLGAEEHVIEFDDGRKIKLSAKEYEEFMKKGTDYLSKYPVYNESVISSILKNKYKDGFDVKYSKIGDKYYYVIIQDGKIIDKFLLSEITDDKGAIDARKLYDRYGNEKTNNSKNKNAYDRNSRFEFSKTMISIDDELSYNSIVEKLEDVKNESIKVAKSLTDSASTISGMEFNCTASVGAINKVANSVESVSTDVDYLENAVDKTVKIYRVCDADLKDVFENKIINEIFGKAGLFVYNKETGKIGRKTTNREDIRENEKFLNILHQAAEEYNADLTE